MSSTKLANLETFARAVAPLRGAAVNVDVAVLADLYDVDWPDDDDADDEPEPTREELIEAEASRGATQRDWHHDNERDVTTMGIKAQKNDDTNAAGLRVKAIAIIEALHVATAARDEASRALSAIGKPSTNQEHLRKCLAEQSFQTAENDVLRLQVEAAMALDLAELAEGDEETGACDPHRLHADVTALFAAEDELRRQLDAQRRKRIERIEQAKKASDAVATRRGQQGLLLSPAMVRVRAGSVHEVLGGVAAFEMRRPAAEASWRNAVATALADLLTVRTRKTRQGEIAALRERETELRAAIERQHREEEARAARVAEFDRRQAEEQREAAARQRNETARVQADAAAKQKELEDLANAHRARESENAA